MTLAQATQRDLPVAATAAALNKDAVCATGKPMEQHRGVFEK
jgi:hypothetical protein